MIHNSSSASDLLPNTETNIKEAKSTKENNKPKAETKGKTEKNKQEDDDKDRKEKPKKKKRDSGYTKALEEASKTIKKAEKEGKQRVGIKLYSFYTVSSGSFNLCGFLNPKQCLDFT